MSLTLWRIFVCKTEFNIGNREWPETVDGAASDADGIDTIGCWWST